MKSKRSIKPLPFRAYFIPVLLLVLTGLIVSLYLAHSHYKNYTDLQYQSFCAISNAINCDTVSQSPYSVFIVPIPIWGIIGYSLLLLLLPFAWQHRGRQGRIWSVLLLITFIFNAVSIALAAVSTYLIGSYCILCIVTYCVNFFLLWYTWLIRRRFAAVSLIAHMRDDLGLLWQRRRVSIPGLALLGGAVLLALVGMPRYWQLTTEAPAGNMTYGMTAEGHPWFGAENADIEIEMFSDYQCFQCRKMHTFLRKMLAGGSEKIKVIHRHYPMDHEVNYIVKQPFHIGSGKMASIAIFAASRGKFWEVNDLLFDIAGRKKQIDLNWIAQKTGLETPDLVSALKDPVIQNRLSRDIWRGMKLRVVGTPSFVIDGQVYAGKIPANILQPHLR